jgi:hypothetical protein
MSPALEGTDLVSDRVFDQYATDGVSVLRQFFEPAFVESLDRGWQTLKRQIAEGTQARNARFVPGSLPDPLDSVYRNANLVKVVQRILGTEMWPCI